MAGLMIEHVMHGRVREASRLASESMAWSSRSACRP
jgi:hypothetical protein